MLGRGLRKWQGRMNEPPVAVLGLGLWAATASPTKGQLLKVTLRLNETTCLEGETF